MSAIESGTLRLPARMENLEAFRQHALDAAKRAGLAAEASGRLELVLEEVLVNVVNYAYPPQGQGQIELAYAVDGPGRLTFTLRDWGPAFDPLAEEDPSLAANREAGIETREPGGLGLLLLRSLSEAEYERENDANVLTLHFGDKNDDGAPF